MKPCANLSSGIVPKEIQVVVTAMVCRDKKYFVMYHVNILDRLINEFLKIGIPVALDTSGEGANSEIISELFLNLYRKYGEDFMNANFFVMDESQDNLKIILTYMAKSHRHYSNMRVALGDEY